MAHSRSWKFLGLGLLITILLLSLMVVWRFLDVLLFGLALAYIIYPVAKKLNRGKTDADMKWLVASLAAVLIVMIPLLLCMFYGMNYVLQWFIKALPSIESGKFLGEIKMGLDSAGLGVMSQRIASEISKLITGFASSIGTSVLKPTWIIEILLKFSLFFISAFYFVFEGPQVKRFMNSQIPKSEKFLQELLMSFHKICYGLFVGHFFTSVIISVIFSAGYWFIFRPDLIFLGLLTVLMFVIAFLPVIGPWFMYVPLAIWHMIFIPGQVTQGIALLAFGLVFLTIIPDFYIRPKLIMRGSEIHPLLIILGFFGGPLMLGLPGIVIGPLVLGLAQAIVQLYVDKRHILKELIEHF